MNEIMHLNIPDLENNFDYIFSVYKNNETNMTTFSSQEGEDPVLAVYKVNDDTLNTIIKNIVNEVEFNCRIFKHYKHQSHSIHKDVGGIKCSLNFMITGYDSPIIFYNDNEIETNKFYYRCGLINTERYHSVPASNNDRVFLRFGFYNSFLEMSNLFKSYKQI